MPQKPLVHERNYRSCLLRCAPLKPLASLSMCHSYSVASSSRQDRAHTKPTRHLPRLDANRKQRELVRHSNNENKIPTHTRIISCLLAPCGQTDRQADAHNSEERWIGFQSHGQTNQLLGTCAKMLETVDVTGAPRHTSFQKPPHMDKASAGEPSCISSWPRSKQVPG